MVTTSRVYYSHETAPPYPIAELKLSYKGLPIQRSPEHSLYSLVTPSGYDVVPQLAGNFTKLSNLHEAIDHFILSCNVASDVFFEKNAPPRRGRPTLDKNKPTLAKLLKETQIGTENTE
jgi:hypothetical protein